MAPQITGGAVDGSSSVRGMSVPNPTPGNDCIRVYDCGANRACGDGDDTLIGHGSVNAQGKFTIAVFPPLRSGQTIFARDVCNNLDGPPITVSLGPVAPVLSPPMMLAMVLALAIVGAFGSLGQRRRSC
jgi:hypothetical protein